MPWTSNPAVFRDKMKHVCDNFCREDATIVLNDGRKFQDTIMGAEANNDAAKHTPAIPQNYWGRCRVENATGPILIDVLDIDQIL